MTESFRRAVLALAVLACGARAAPAQTAPRWEAFVGYAVAHVSPDRVTMPIGWEASFARPLTGWLAAVVDGGGTYKTETIFDGAAAHLSTHTVLAGVQVSARIGRLVEFGRVLGGVAHTRASLLGLTDSATRAALEPGVGLDWPLTRTLAARATVGLQLTGVGHEWRVGTGVVLRLR